MQLEAFFNKIFGRSRDPQASVLRKELLLSYAGSQVNVFKGYLLIAVLFILARFYLYDLHYFTDLYHLKDLQFFDTSPGIAVDDRGMTSDIHYISFLHKEFLPFFGSLGMLLLSLVGVVLQRSFYKNSVLARAATLKPGECDLLTLKIAGLRALYMVPWLAVMFMPMHSKYVYDHVLGYIFVFCAASVYASASAAVTFLLAFDIGLQLAFVLCVTILNIHTQETPWIGGFFTVFCGYSIYLGRRFQESLITLVRSKEEIARSAEEKSRFLAMMSHEIRTPMTGILGMIDFLKETHPTPEQSGFINTISDCSKTLLHTLNDILDISKLEAGKLEISTVNFDFHAVLGNAVRVMTGIAEQKGLALSLVIDANVPRMVSSDPHRVQQIALNFLNNAIKFTGHGKVTMHAAYRESACPVMRVEVTDTGIGISAANIKKLFKGFSQADSSIARQYGGSGLGLSIVRNLVTLMGGKVGVKSKEGEGSTFWFDLPYHAPNAATTVDETEPEVRPLYILLAEDNKVNQQVATHLLNSRHHRVAIAEDGNAAVRMVQEEPFDLILMDMNMPVKSGIEAAAEIRALGGRYAVIPMIALTANVVDEYVQKCYEAGMNAHVAKPFSPLALYKTIARVAPPPAGVAPVAESPAPATPEIPLLQMNLNDSLREIRQQLGGDYMKILLETSIREIERLLQEIAADCEKNDYEAVSRNAHDLKSVSCLIGMNETGHYADVVEKMCLDEKTSGIEDMIRTLTKSGIAELAVAEELKG